MPSTQRPATANRRSPLAGLPPSGDCQSPTPACHGQYESLRPQNELLRFKFSKQPNTSRSNSRCARALTRTSPQALNTTAPRSKPKCARALTRTLPQALQGTEGGKKRKEKKEKEKKKEKERKRKKEKERREGTATCAPRAFFTRRLYSGVRI